MPVETAVRLVQGMGIDFDSATLRGWEYGWTGSPDPLRLLALARVYEVTMPQVLEALTLSRSAAAKPIRIPASLADEPAPTTVEGFKAVRLLARPIAAGQPLTLEPDEKDSSLAFRDDVVSKFKKPLCLRVGRKEESMVPTIMPGDVVVIDHHEERRRKPVDGHIYAVNYGPLTGEGGAIKRVEVTDNGILILISDNPDKGRYGTKAFSLEGKNLLDIIKGEVVWYGRYVGSGKGR